MKLPFSFSYLRRAAQGLSLLLPLVLALLGGTLVIPVSGADDGSPAPEFKAVGLLHRALPEPGVSRGGRRDNRFEFHKLPVALEGGGVDILAGMFHLPPEKKVGNLTSFGKTRSNRLSNLYKTGFYKLHAEQRGGRLHVRWETTSKARPGAGSETLQTKGVPDRDGKSADLLDRNMQLNFELPTAIVPGEAFSIGLSGDVETKLRPFSRFWVRVGGVAITPQDNADWLRNAEWLRDADWLRGNGPPVTTGVHPPHDGRSTSWLRSTALHYSRPNTELLQHPQPLFPLIVAQPPGPTPREATKKASVSGKVVVAPRTIRWQTDGSTRTVYGSSFVGVSDVEDLEGARKHWEAGERPGIPIDSLESCQKLAVYLQGWPNSGESFWGARVTQLAGYMFNWIGPIYVVYERSGTQLQEAEIHEVLRFPGVFSEFAKENKAEITEVWGKEVQVEVEIVEVDASAIQVRVPPEVITSDAEFLQRVFDEGETSSEVEITFTVREGTPEQTVSTERFRWIYPRPLVYDEVALPPSVVPQHILPQFELTGDHPPTARTFFFIGRRQDELVGLRVRNTAQGFPPLTLNTAVFVPREGEVPPFQQFNEGKGNYGIHLNVNRDRVHVIAVFQEPSVSLDPPGLTVNKATYPQPFEIHLAGDAGLPQKMINGKGEYPRATRHDTLFNHVAPRPQVLTELELKKGSKGAPTALFKFTNKSVVTKNAVAVLVPPTASPGGMPAGGAYRRARDPGAPISVTTPTAAADFQIGPGRVIDFTQLPYPWSVGGGPSVNNTPAALIGEPVSDPAIRAVCRLPLENGCRSLILDMGSGSEIVDGKGDDAELFATSGNYQIAFGNTPYADSFVPLEGTFSGQRSFDLAPTGLSSARYVRVTAAPEVTLDAIQARNVFADRVERAVGLDRRVGTAHAEYPVLHRGRATMTMRRAKSPQTDIDPHLVLMAPDGKILEPEQPGRFGDPTNKFLNDVAFASKDLAQTGFYRFLAKGYDQRPGPQSFGRFYVRLETHGDWDQNNFRVAEGDEAEVRAQKQGRIRLPHERDSYVFQAKPGQQVRVAVSALDAPLNPVVELYDPEGFLIAANDDYPGRGKNAAFVVTLPSVSLSEGGALPDPAVYRVVVSAIDKAGLAHSLGGTNFHVRAASGGNYAMKVFAGRLEGEVSVTPGSTSPPIELPPPLPPPYPPPRPLPPTVDAPAKGAAATRLKCAMKPVPAALREKTGIDKGGVYFDRIEPGPLKRAGVQSGDLLLSVDDLSVDSVELFNKLVSGWEKGDEKSVLIMRGGDDIRVLNVTVD